MPVRVVTASVLLVTQVPYIPHPVPGSLQTVHPIAPAVLASAAVPGAVKPVDLYGHTLLDGGVLSPVPVEIARKLHPGLIIAVDLSQFTAAPPKTAMEVMDSAYHIMGQRLTSVSIRGADVIISPKVGNVGLFDISKKHEMYLAGYNATRRQIPKIRKLLGEIAGSQG